MKNDERPSVKSVEEEILPWSAQVELHHVSFSLNPSIGVDFYNEIDPWTNMQHSFKHKIMRPNVSRGLKEFKSLYYSVKGRAS